MYRDAAEFLLVKKNKYRVNPAPIHDHPLEERRVGRDDEGAGGCCRERATVAASWGTFPASSVPVGQLGGNTGNVTSWRRVA